MVKILEFLNCQLFFNFFLIFLGFLFIITALCMILTESSVHSILYLMFILLYLTELTIVLKMEFLALIFIIVYIGAVCVLMLFHIKLIKTFIHRFDNLNNNYLFFPVLIVSIILPFIQILTLSFQFQNNIIVENIASYKLFLMHYKEMNFTLDYTQASNYTSWVNLLDSLTSTQILGFLLYNVYFIYLILGSLILLVAMIGSIFLTLIKQKDKKFQKIDKQIFIDISTKINFNNKKK